VIEKIVAIKNVGKLLDCSLITSGTWDGKLARTTLIYADNGAGKTTLAKVMASLAGQDVALIMGRKTLGAADSPKVELKTSGGCCKFENGAWQGRLDKAEIFDADFIMRNVHAGDHVATEHRQNLCEFSLGETAVALSKKVDETDDSMREVDSQMRDKKQHILPRVIENMDFELFLRLPPDDQVLQKIEEKKATISRLEKADSILEKGLLAEACKPEFDRAALSEVLSSSLADVSRDAANCVKRHIAENLDEKGEKWLDYGLGKIHENRCPFCGQDVRSCELTQAYGQYFSDAYRDFKLRLQSASDKVERCLSADSLSAVTEAIASNQGLWQYWKDHILFELAEPDREGLAARWRAASAAILEVLKHKLSDPLTIFPLGAELEAQVKVLEEILREVDSHNAQVRGANTLITARKGEVSRGNLDAERMALASLRNQARRHEEPVATLCREYLALVQQKDDLAAEKKRTKAQLDKHLKAFAKTYVGELNQSLKSLYADFTLGQAARELVNFKGRKANLDYGLVIRGVPVPLGTPDCPADRPSFRNTLSEGDKGTLAFAFFLTKLNRSPNLSDTVVVLDDPINSFDANRKSATVAQIRKLSERAGQVLVLTHDMSFASLVRADITDALFLQLRYDGPVSVGIAEWDVDRVTADRYYRTYLAVQDFVDDRANNLDRVASDLRTLLEANLRMRFPVEFFGKKLWLGQMVEAIRTSTSADPLHVMYNRLEDLEELLSYSKRFHHDNGNATGQVPVHAELLEHAKRSLLLCGS
jgi:wobble nucleotide-excising tRNase